MDAFVPWFVSGVSTAGDAAAVEGMLQLLRACPKEVMLAHHAPIMASVLGVLQGGEACCASVEDVATVPLDGRCLEVIRRCVEVCSAVALLMQQDFGLYLIDTMSALEGIASADEDEDLRISMLSAWTVMFQVACYYYILCI
jgi:hypothetical protein